jgi:hypothetical protein
MSERKYPKQKQSWKVCFHAKSIKTSMFVYFFELLEIDINRFYPAENFEAITWVSDMWTIIESKKVCQVQQF